MEHVCNGCLESFSASLSRCPHCGSDDWDCVETSELELRRSGGLDGDC